MKDINEIVKKWEHVLNSDTPKGTTAMIIESQEKWIYDPTKTYSLSSTQPPTNQTTHYES